MTSVEEAQADRSCPACEHQTLGAANACLPSSYPIEIWHEALGQCRRRVPMGSDKGRGAQPFCLAVWCLSASHHLRHSSSPAGLQDHPVPSAVAARTGPFPTFCLSGEKFALNVPLCLFVLVGFFFLPKIVFSINFIIKTIPNS